MLFDNYLLQATGRKKMNTYLRKIKKNSKALSPVIASIILIAVTVAVSVVVAAWMGGMTIGFMGNAEQVSITNIAFVPDAAGDTLQVMVTNSGSTPATINTAFINGLDSSTGMTSSPAQPIAKSSSATITLSLPTGITQLDAGSSYQVKLITQKGTSVVNTATYNP
jgi:archaeal type IV pilus assembly protein PilA